RRREDRRQAEAHGDTPQVCGPLRVRGDPPPARLVSRGALGMALLIALAAFVTSVLAVLAIYRLATRRREFVRRRIGRFVAPALDRRVMEEREPFAPGGEFSRGQALRRLLRSIGDLFKARSIGERVEAELERANVPMRGSEFVGL